jgi:hypothetical protein
MQLYPSPRARKSNSYPHCECHTALPHILYSPYAANIDRNNYLSPSEPTSIPDVGKKKSTKTTFHVFSTPNSLSMALSPPPPRPRSSCYVAKHESIKVQMAAEQIVKNRYSGHTGNELLEHVACDLPQCTHLEPRRSVPI